MTATIHGFVSMADNLDQGKKALAQVVAGSQSRVQQVAPTMPLEPQTKALLDAMQAAGASLDFGPICRHLRRGASWPRRRWRAAIAEPVARVEDRTIPGPGGADSGAHLRPRRRRTPAGVSIFPWRWMGAGRPRH